MRTMLRGKFTLLFMMFGLLLAVPAIALADVVTNNLEDNTVDNTAEVMPLQVGGANGTTKLYVAPTGSGSGGLSETFPDTAGNNGCNLAGNTTNLQLDVTSSDPSKATVSPASVTIDDCGEANGVTLTVSPVAAGSTTITVARKAGTSGSASGNFDVGPATFTVNVTPPPNTPPQVEVTGVEGGANYNKGSVPTAMCQVTDTEDGNSSFPATLSPISGPYASDSIGSQEASCSYTDNGPGPGLTATDSVIYNIVDPSAPVIGYTLDPANADGTNGWYKGNVTLTWNVSEPQSPNSLVKTGCDNQNIIADQAETTYSCSATSAGGSSGTPVSVTIKRDGTAPSVVTNGAATGTLGDNNWYKTAVIQPFRASDALSGLVGHTSPYDFSNPSGAAEGDNVSISSGAFDDNAGNSNSGTSAGPFKIDLTNPTITSSLVNGSGDPLAAASTGWYNSNTGAPTAHFSCNDPDGDNVSSNGVGSGVASCAADHTFGSSADPQSHTGNVRDNAGRTNSTSAGPVKVDLSKPTGIAFTGSSNVVTDGATYDFNEVPAAPTGCSASDTFSGMPANGCVLDNGYSTAVGHHTITATATDTAGNVETKTLSYDVRGWTLTNLYAPVDYGTITNNVGSVPNTVKNGSTVPLKFEVFKKDANKTELTDTAIVNQPLTARQVTCDWATSNEDPIEELASTNGMSVRYDATGGQFIYNWQTPKKPGNCYLVGVSTKDGSATALAKFKLK